MNLLNSITQESIKTADQETLVSWFVALQAWSKSRKQDTDFQRQLRENLKQKTVGAANLEVARYSVLATQVRRRLVHAFNCTSYNHIKL